MDLYQNETIMAVDLKYSEKPSLFLKDSKPGPKDEVEPLDYSRPRKALIFVMAVFEGLVFSCILLGWSSMEYIYQQEGVYAELCVHTHNLTTNT